MKRIIVLITLMSTILFANNYKNEMDNLTKVERIAVIATAMGPLFNNENNLKIEEILNKLKKLNSYAKSKIMKKTLGRIIDVMEKHPEIKEIEKFRGEIMPAYTLMGEELDKPKYQNAKFDKTNEEIVELANKILD